MRIKQISRVLDLYGHSHDAVCAEISGYTYTDEQIAETVAETYKNTGYLLDPHGAVAYRSLEEGLEPEETGIFLETAHPAKFKATVEAVIGEEMDIPDKLAAFLNRDKKTVKMNSGFTSFKNYLMSV